MTSPTPQPTDFSLDVLGRFFCNGLDEALRSADPAVRPDARPFDVIVIGGGAFGGVLAQHLFYSDKAHRHRILVLDAGRFAVPEHVQNLPMLGLNVPGATNTDPGALREQVWGLPWRSDVPGGFPGLAYCLGGRSVYFGGWSPRLLDQPGETEMPRDRWPDAVVAELNNQYFREAADQIGTSETNDYIFGELHNALRDRLAQNIGTVTGAIPLNDLPDHPAVPAAPTVQDLLDLLGLPAPAGPPPALQDLLNLLKVEAPLAVQGRPPRSGFFPINKFSSTPLMFEAARAAQTESGGDDVKKRLMVVPNCHVTRLVTAVIGGVTHVTDVLTNLGPIALPPDGVVVLASGTIESARLALTSFPLLPDTGQIGRGLIAHLRSNLTISIPRAALPPGLPNSLQASALFLKGRHTRGDGSLAHFHLQITAAGLDRPGTDSEAELFKKIPDIDTVGVFRDANDDRVIITLRGIGEMVPDNPNSHVTLGTLDEFGLPRAFVSLADARQPQPGESPQTTEDRLLWETMDRAADDAALAFANGQPYQVLTPSGYQTLAAGQRAVTVFPFVGRRDGMGTTHHEAGTLRLGDDPNTAVTDRDARFHHVDNAYVAGPALFPTSGSPNPMLTGTALARRLAEHLAAPPPIPVTPGFQLLFDGADLSQWRMSTIRNQPPDRSDPGRFLIVDGALEALPGNDLGLLWYTQPMPPDFILKLEWLSRQADDNSGVFVRFPHPDSKGYNNTAWVGVDFGFEVQIDDRAAPDGAAIHKTGAIYNFAGPADPNNLPVRPLGQWNQYEIHVQGQSYRVRLNGVQVTAFDFVAGSDAAHPDRGLPSAPGVPRFIGLQTHTGRLAFRNIQMQPIPAPAAAAAAAAAPEWKEISEAMGGKRVRKATP